ncbi:Exostoses (Multiple)-like 3, partial [Cladochytrium tenue]
MDDDWDMPHDHLAFSIKLFQGHFFNHLIGFGHLGRTHKVDPEDKSRWTYSTDNKKDVSIVLPSGSVFHRKYLDMYTHALPQVARDKVDELTNCDDILLNMMVANATGSCPVVVEGLHAKALDMGGLWTDPAHFGERSECLTFFARHVFGGRMPLRYTASFFKSGGTRPGLKDLRCHV